MALIVSPRSRFRPEDVVIGRYLTDGITLYRIRSVLRPNVLLENCKTPEAACSWLEIGELTAGSYWLVTPEIGSENG